MVRRKVDVVVCVAWMVRKEVEVVVCVCVFVFVTSGVLDGEKHSDKAGIKSVWAGFRGPLIGI